MPKLIKTQYLSWSDHEKIDAHFLDIMAINCLY